MGVMKSVSGTSRSGFSRAEVSADTYLTVISQRSSSPRRHLFEQVTRSDADPILCDSGLLLPYLLSLRYRNPIRFERCDALLALRSLATLLQNQKLCFRMKKVYGPNLINTYIEVCVAYLSI